MTWELDGCGRWARSRTVRYRYSTVQFGLVFFLSFFLSLFAPPFLFSSPDARAVGHSLERVCTSTVLVECRGGREGGRGVEGSVR